MNESDDVLELVTSGQWLEKEKELAAALPRGYGKAGVR